MRISDIRLWPKNLAGQFIFLLLIVLILSQVITSIVLLQEKNNALQGVNRRGAVNQIYATIRLLRESPTNLHRSILRSASSNSIRFWVTSSAPSVDSEYTLESRFFNNAFKSMGINKVIVLGDNVPESLNGHRNNGFFDHQRFHDMSLREWRYISLELSDQKWLNVALRSPPPPAPVSQPLNLLSIFITAICLIFLVIFMVRRITRPLRDLTQAADQLGRGETVEPLKLSGPYDVKKAMISFNTMNERLMRFMQERSSMLAAVSHDLRTPITSLKLRAELLEDETTQAAFLTTLDEMQSIADSTLTFLRDDAYCEAAQSVDLTALVSSLCEDLAMQGYSVAFNEGKEIYYTCRIVALKRALNNLLGNAVKYGERADVSINIEGAEFAIYIDDAGQGIPTQQIEEMFTPFTRLEKSRNKETGGVGLGLAIARSIARSHGGDVKLQNLPTGGLRASLILPLQS